MIIDNSYFVGELHISQVGASASAKVNNNDVMERFIDKYEVELIDCALGRHLSREFFSNFDAFSGRLVSGVDSKWSNLLEGTTYESCGKEHYWQGLRNKTGNLKRSIVAYYVYYNYMQDNIIQKSTMGTVRPDAENTRNAGAIPTLTRAWRNFIDWYGDGYGYGYGNSGIYQYKYPRISHKHSGVILDFRGEHDSRNVSLQRFLLDNMDIYEGLEFTPLYNKNQFQV